ncbi:MAG: crossover junction endodeoxyribonuclease RuvC [Phycisphaerales bacterium]|jgi:crossover junction endodeoxyribonuclease RuvC|nr:crossover junction endodeoxyribonuclease RuvC [Phycisphaerales bacterium]
MAKPNKLQVLGIDPGLRVAGYGCVVYNRSNPHPTLVEAGAIKLDTSKSVSLRLRQLWTDITQIIAELSPDIVAVETVFSQARQVGSAITLGHARGVILLAVEQAGLPLVELAPAEIKKAITGNGRSSKTQIQQAVAHVLNLEDVPEPSDVADALAIGITGALRS